MAKTNAVVRQHAMAGTSPYPFTDEATLTSNEDDARRLPVGMFVDACVYPPGGGDRQYVSRVFVRNGTMTVTVSDDRNELCSASVDLGSGTRELTLTDVYGRPCGLLLGNPNLAEFAGAMGDGEHTFNSEATELVASCVLPQPQVAVGGLVAGDGTHLLAGNVWLVGKNGVVVAADAANNAVRVHVVGDPLFKRRQCLDAVVAGGGTPFVASRPLRRIRVFHATQGAFELVPDEYGTVFVTPGANQAVDNVTRVDQKPGGFQLRLLGNLVPGSGTDGGT